MVQSNRNEPHDGNLVYGHTDKPCTGDSHDYLGINKYVNALSQFVHYCHTPIVISVQGDWGSGKTSLMNKIRHKLNDSTCSMWIETWQYSEMTSNNNISSLLLYDFIVNIEAEMENYVDKKHLSFIKSSCDFLKVSYRFFNSARKRLKKKLILSSDITNINTAGLGSTLLSGIINATSMNKADTVRSLKEKLQDKISSYLEKAQKDKLVIFIDDLDRLEPEHALKILECLKIFLDIKMCVFILAIDTDILLQRMSKMYGDDFDFQGKKNFVDKIVQLPFNLPVGRYTIDKYIADLAPANILSRNDYGLCSKLIQYSVGNNPRTIKRLFNVVQLMWLAAASDDDIGKNRELEVFKKLMFASVCLEFGYEGVYRRLVNERNKSPNILSALRAEEEIKKYPLYYEEILRFSNTSQIRKNNFFEFTNLMFSLINESSNHISHNGANKFWSVLTKFSIGHIQDEEDHERQIKNSRLTTIKTFLEEFRHADILNNLGIKTVLPYPYDVLIFQCDTLGPMSFNLEFKLTDRGFETLVSDPRNGAHISHRQSVFDFFKRYEQHWPIQAFRADNDIAAYLDLNAQNLPVDADDAYDLQRLTEFKKYVQDGLDIFLPLFADWHASTFSKLTSLHNAADLLDQKLQAVYPEKDGWLISTTSWKSFDKWSRFSIVKATWKGKMSISMESANFFAAAPLIIGLRKGDGVPWTDLSRQEQKDLYAIFNSTVRPNLSAEAAGIRDKHLHVWTADDKHYANSWYIYLGIRNDLSFCSGDLFNGEFKPITDACADEIYTILAAFKNIEPVLDGIASRIE